MTGAQGETDLETAVRKLKAMSKHLDEFFKEAAGVTELLASAYQQNSRLKIFRGLSDLHFAASNSETAIKRFSESRKAFDNVTANASGALEATRG